MNKLHLFIKENTRLLCPALEFLASAKQKTVLSIPVFPRICASCQFKREL